MRRLILVAFGLLVAISAGAVFFLVAAFIDPVVGQLVGGLFYAGVMTFLDIVSAAGDPGPELATASAQFGRILVALLVAPPLFTALVGEIAGWRALSWYAGVTGAITAAMPFAVRAMPRQPSPEELRITLVLFLVGAASGLVYWLLAGQGAGWRPAPHQRETARP